MSKKIIAIASSVALTLSAFAAVPALAAAVTVGSISVEAAADHAAPTGLGTATSPFKVSVPEANSTEYSATTAADSNVLEFTFTAVTGANVTSTGAIELIDSADYADGLTIDDGVTSLDPAAGSATFYAYTTSTTAGTIVVKNGGVTTTIYLKGIAGEAYSWTATVPKSIKNGGTAKVIVVAKDLFGNKLGSTGNLNSLAVTGYGSLNGTGDAPTALTYSTSAGGFVSTITHQAGEGTGSLKIDWSAPSTVDGYEDPSDTVYAVVTVSDGVAAAEALAAKYQALATKYAAKFNKLAAKWNKKFPNSKVALIK